MTDPAALTAQLIRCPSVTPEDGGALDLVQDLLTRGGFTCTRVPRGGIDNLFARWGDKGHPRSFGFNGHTDVVPVGNPDDWTDDPFSGIERDGKLWGRGATDMKSGVAAFAAAAVDFVQDTPPDGAIILAITGDEEAQATDGTVALLEWMATQGEAMSVCLVGEPTCPENMGDMIKIGRRGSLNVQYEIEGVQGHSAYPHRANNPLSAMATLTQRLATHVLDEGTEHFDASTIALTSIDTGNAATNVIPARAVARANIRFNDLHSGAGLTDWLRGQGDIIASETGTVVTTQVRVSGEAFLTPPGPLSDLVSAAVAGATGRNVQLSTTGGTSDARFVKDHCPVVEFGLVGKTMHQVDEHVEIAHIHQLKDIYGRILRDYFA